MMQIRDLIANDPSLSPDIRRAIRSSPRDGARALMRYGLSCREAAELLDQRHDALCAVNDATRSGMSDAS